MFHDRSPTVARVGRTVHLPAGSAEIDAALIERVDSHGIAQYVEIAIALRQTFRELLPLVSASFTAIDAQLAVERKMISVALYRHDLDCFRFVRVDVDYETEVSRQVAADFFPGVAGIVAAHHVPMLLHEKHARA